jgi:hypothetical protein
MVAMILLGLLVPNRVAPPRVSIDTGGLEGAVDSASGVLVFRGIPPAAAAAALDWRAPRAAARPQLHAGSAIQ